MWPRHCVDFYVHEEFEMPYQFTSDQTLGGPYIRVPRSAPLLDFVKYISKLARFPEIVLHVRNNTGLRWFVIPVHSPKDLDDLVAQIE